MRRYQAICGQCGLPTLWQGNRDSCRDEMLLHFKHEHGQVAEADYELKEQRQCDYCLEVYLDHCTKCGRDFCRFHQGDIDGLCGGCI